LHGYAPVLVSARAGTPEGNREAQAGAACQEAAPAIITFSLIERQAKVLREHIADKKQFCLFSTGSLIGEGFDLPELDTMMITMPISFKGRLTQYVGRLHRQNSPDKKETTVYDYVDTCSGMTISMFKKRLSAYKRLGYIPVYDPGARIARWI
jgi:hypothetical protein